MRFPDDRRVRVSGKWCVYCGMAANTDEHYPPSTYSATGLILPACGECNNLASTEWPTNFEKRVAHVKSKLEWRHRKALKMPVWTADDLDELSSEMRREIKIWQKRSRIAKQRIAWNAMSYLSSIDSGNVFAVLNARLNTSTD